MNTPNTNPFIEDHPGDTLAHVAQGIAFLREAFFCDVRGREMQINKDAATGLQHILRGLQEAVEHASAAEDAGAVTAVVGGQGR